MNILIYIQFEQFISDYYILILKLRGVTSHNMSCHLSLFTQHQTQPCRNINQIIILFSLSHELRIKINGELKDLDAHIAIINHGDIYEIKMRHISFN